jgi:predicted acetyltransferase
MRMQALLAGQGTMADRIMWHGPPGDILAYLLTEQRAKIIRALDWMLRVIDVPAGLTARGYPIGLTVELHLDIVDPVLPWNHGRWVLHVVNGQAEVEPGGAGSLRLDVRDLAALYTGHLLPSTLARVGSLEGSAADLAKAQLLFSSDRPALRDIF